MAAVPDQVLNWLYSVLTSEYHDVNRTYSNVAEALAHYPSLRPRTDVFTYDNGESALLLVLGGTLPVQFRGAVYRFPVALWVPHAYPHASPIVFVQPAKDQLVRPGQHVSAEGMIYHPYLAQWARYWDKSSILDFLSVLRGVFAKEPPVISKQQQQANVAAGTPAPPPVPPPPEEWRRSMQGGAPPASTQQSRPPSRPPKERDAPQELGHHPTSPLAQPPSRAESGPPLPPHPPGSAERFAAQPGWRPPPDPAPPNGAARHHFAAQMRSHPAPFEMQSPPHRLPQAPHHQHENPVSPVSPSHSARGFPPHFRSPMPPSQSAHGHAGPQWQSPTVANAPGEGQQPPTRAGYPQYAQPPQYHPPAGLQQPPKPRQPAVDLMDSPLEVALPSQTGRADPVVAPPIPPNPEKDALLRALSSALCDKTRQAIAENASAIAPLQAQQQALRQAYAHLQSEVEQTKQLDAALASNESILRGAMREADRVMEEARTRTVPDVDDVLVAPTTVGGQLYALCAEERASGDAMFVLGRALDRGRIGCDVFIKQTRSMAREQFLKKALIRKIADGMGLEQATGR